MLLTLLRGATNTLWFRQGAAWKPTATWIKVSGQWKQAVVWRKVNGTWQTW